MTGRLQQFREESAPFKVVATRNIHWDQPDGEKTTETRYYFTRQATKARYALCWYRGYPWELFERQTDGSWLLVESFVPDHSELPEYMRPGYAPAPLISEVAREAFGASET